jgi:signal-transduction protein with cAMP-binding, CBS, and nucleotidyltransferase domain
MTHVRDLLGHKKNGDGVLTTFASALTLEVIEKMVDRNVGSIVVIDAFNRIQGIFTERDYLRRIVMENRSPKTTLVQDVMSLNQICVHPGQSLEECMSIMTSRRIRHLPVTEDNQLIGIVSIGDIVRSLSMEHRCEIKHLTDYITGQYPGEGGIVPGCEGGAFEKQ